MNIKVIVLTVLVSSLVVIAIGIIFVYSGIYDVAASQPDGAVTRWVVTTTRDRSIERRTSGIAVPVLNDPSLVEEGFEHYREMCTGCHLAPGTESSEMRTGLNPQPPVLAKLVPHSSPARLFRVIKNGVKMTGMPAWGTTHSDQMIWAIVAFLERLPTMTPAEYQALDKAHPPEPDPEEQSSQDHAFLDQEQ